MVASAGSRHINGSWCTKLAMQLHNSAGHLLAAQKIPANIANAHLYCGWKFEGYFRQNFNRCKYALENQFLGIFKFVIGCKCQAVRANSHRNVEGVGRQL
jgi:hypothetical protein